jgi:nephrocystin-4
MIDWYDVLGHVSLVTDIDEWRSLKAIHGLTTPAEDGVILGRQLWLQPQELIYIPIKYQGWQYGQVALHDDSMSGASSQVVGHSMATAATAANVAARPLAARTLALHVRNVKGDVVGSVDIRICPQPYVVDQTFRFHQSEHEFLKTTIRISPMRWDASVALPQQRSLSAVGIEGSTSPGTHVSRDSMPLSNSSVWVRSSDPDVQCGVHERSPVPDSPEVFIKFKCGASPTVTRFLVLVYADKWQHRLLETWELIVHALQRVDVHALVGQTSLAKALLRANNTVAQGLVQCFSSHPRELRLSPNMPFALRSGLTEVSLSLRPLQPGRRQYVVHAVDLTRHALLSSWLVCAVNRLPAITKAFSLQVPVALGARKKVSLANPYTYNATFTLYADQSNLVNFASQTLSIPARSSRYIGLHFVPQPPAVTDGDTRVLIFVNNEEDKNEECMEIQVKYVI